MKHWNEGKNQYEVTRRIITKTSSPYKDIYK